MYRSILVAIDGGNETASAIETAFRLSDVFDANVHVLYIKNIRLGRSARWMNKNQRNGEEIVREAAQYADEQGIDVTTAIESGTPANTVLRYLQDEEIDLLVIGVRKEPAIIRTLTESTTTKIVQNASIPVLAVPRRENE